MASKAAKGANVAVQELLIAHLADNHLLTSQYGNRERGKDFFDSFEDAVRISCDRDVDVICQVGDILDCSKPTAEVIRQLQVIDRTLRARNKLMLCVTGNHDWSTPLWTEVIGERLGPDIPDDACGIVPIDGQTVTFRGVRFHGLPQMSPRQFVLNRDQLKMDKVDVALFHGIVDDIVPIYTGGEFHITPDDFGKVPLVLLGDLHMQAYVRNKHGGFIGYCGATESKKADDPTVSSVPVICFPNPKVVDKLSVRRRAMVYRDIVESGGFDDLISEIRELRNPVVIVNYDRSLAKETARLWTIDSPGMLLRVRPMAKTKEEASLRTGNTGERHDLRYFVAKRMKERPDLAALADDLVIRGDDDAFNIVAKFVEEREKAICQ